MGKLFSKPKIPTPPPPPELPKYEPPPEPEPVAEMPVPDDVALETSKKKKLALKAKRSGRASTFLTSDDEGTLG